MRRSKRQRAEEAVPSAPARLLGPAALLLVLIAILAYVPALRAGFIWDDDTYVTGNPTLVSFEGLRRIWIEPGAVPQYYPMTFTSLWLDHQLFGNQPLGYHLINVLLHTANALIVWRLFHRWGFGGAWLAAALFAVHPLHVESVAWVTERKNVLSGLFYLTAAWASFRYAGLLPAPRTSDRRGAPVERRRLWYTASLTLFACALLSKTVTCSLPAAVLLALYWRRGRIGGRDVVALAPFFAVGLALASVTIHMEEAHVGAAGAEWALSWVGRILLAGRALCFYAGKLLWPHPLIFIYPRWDIDPAAWWQYAFPLAVLAVGLATFLLRRRFGRGPACAVFFFAGTLTPALGFFNVYLMRFSFVADHFCYLASLGPLLLAAAALEGVRRPGAPYLREGLAAVVLLLLGLVTWNRGYAYADEATLWRDTLAHNPSAWIAYNNLGTDLLERGRTREGVDMLEQALRLKPNLDDAHNNLGVVAMSEGRLDDARWHFSEAVRISPCFGAALVNLASTLQMGGRYEEAIVRYRQALGCRPLDLRVQQILPKVHTNIGLALESTGQREAAMAEYREALRLDPTFAPARQQLAAAIDAAGAATP